MSHIAKKARQNGGGRAAIARPHSTANEDAVVAEDGKGSKKVMTSDDKPESVPFKRYHGAKLMMGDSVFAELELAEAAQKVGGVRVRQHVNPLKASLQSQAPVPAWTDVYASTARPLVVDIGCGGGRFDLMMAKKYPETNFLGVDIRAPLVERGNKWGEYAGVVDNLHFAECNATVSMGKWLKSYADDCGSKVETVAIQFPDPHFKKRHHKRRVVQPCARQGTGGGTHPRGSRFPPVRRQGRERGHAGQVREVRRAPIRHRRQPTRRLRGGPQGSQVKRGVRRGKRRGCVSGGREGATQAREGGEGRVPGTTQGC
jgi:tRNA (guanine-N7-)-methyltransferase